MTDSTTIHGYCDPRFSAVREAFAANFGKGLEVGACFAAYLDGEPIIDLWAGVADETSGQPWTQHSIACVFSTTKAMTAICAHILADRGLLDFDAPVAKYWPEFAQAGKGDMPVRYIMSHQAGLPSVTEPLPAEVFYDWERMTAALAAETPWWEPGTANGYHAISYGFLVGEVIRRITGKSVGSFFAEEVARPLGVDFHIGLAPEYDARVATMIPGETQPGADLPADSIMTRVLSNPPFSIPSSNTRAFRAAEIPAANGHGNARGLARVMAAMARGGELDGVRLMSEETIARSIATQCYREDLGLGRKAKWGLGYMLRSDEMPISPNERAFGHGGAGGSLAIADLDARLGWSYVMNKMAATTVGDVRAFKLARALYGSL